MRFGVVIAVLVLAACPKPLPPGTPPPTPAKCSGNLLEQCGPQVLPLVGECLASSADVVGCVLGITKLVGCATYEILACVVRHEGETADHAYKANADDSVDFKRARRAKEFLERTKAQFE